MMRYPTVKSSLFATAGKPPVGQPAAPRGAAPGRSLPDICGFPVLLLPLLLGFVGGTASGVWAAQPSGPYLPQTSLFELTRQSDMIVLARPGKGNTVRVVEVIGRKGGPKALHVAYFSEIYMALRQPATKRFPAQSFKDYDQVLLFLERRGESWWICETIPRARAANGCVWVRNGQAHWYYRNPWPYGPRLIERDPADARPGRAYREKTTIQELLQQIRSWNYDLTRLRAIDKLTEPIEQVRALRAFVHPSTRPRHSPDATALAKQIHREVGRQVFGDPDGKTPQPVARSAWELVRGGPPEAVATALNELKSKDPKEREAALKQVHAAARPEVTQAALEALDDSNPQVQLAAATALADFADASCSSTLIARFRALKDPKDPLRNPLTIALATSNEPAALAELILALQEITESIYYKRQVADLLLWRFAVTVPDPSRPEYTSALWWSPRYEKRYGQKIRLRPWDFARLQSLIRGSSSQHRQLSAGELKLIPAQTIDQIIQRCADKGFPHRERWCELIFRAWDAGGLSDDQKRATLETFGRIESLVRSRYPLGTSAEIPVSSAWPQPVYLPQTMRVTSKSGLYINGVASGRPYPIRDLRIYVRPFSPGDFGPGKHSFYIETEYSIRAGKSTFSHKVRSDEHTFEVVLPGEPFDIEAKSDPVLDAKVEQAFVFIADDGTSPAKSTQRDSGRRPNRYPMSGGGYLEFRGDNRWELTEALPFDLAFDVQYELLDQGVVLDGFSLYIPQGQTRGDRFNPYYISRRLPKLEESGSYRFRVRLTPSCDVALAHPDSRAYWNGHILEGPEMTFRVVKIPRRTRR